MSVEAFWRIFFLTSLNLFREKFVFSVEPMAGFEPATSSLPRKCSTPELHRRLSDNWSGRRGSNSRPSAWKADALSTELLPHFSPIWRLWAKMDSNHRRHKPADLQSAPFGHSGIRPITGTCQLTSPLIQFWASCRIRTNDPEITNHVLWPTELKRHFNFRLLRSKLFPFATANVRHFFLLTKYFDTKFSL